MHSPHELGVSEVMHLWSFDEPVTLALLAVSGTVYAVGTARMRFRSAAACRRFESGAEAPHSKGLSE